MDGMGTTPQVPLRRGGNALSGGRGAWPRRGVLCGSKQDVHARCTQRPASTHGTREESLLRGKSWSEGRDTIWTRRPHSWAGCSSFWGLSQLSS